MSKKPLDNTYITNTLLLINSVKCIYNNNVLITKRNLETDKSCGIGNTDITKSIKELNNFCKIISDIDRINIIYILINYEVSYFSQIRKHGCFANNEALRQKLDSLIKDGIVENCKKTDSRVLNKIGVLRQFPIQYKNGIAVSKGRVPYNWLTLSDYGNKLFVNTDITKLMEKLVYEKVRDNVKKPEGIGNTNITKTNQKKCDVCNNPPGGESKLIILKIPRKHRVCKGCFGSTEHKLYSKKLKEKKN